jgi:type VI protein secretion system component Hcp
LLESASLNWRKQNGDRRIPADSFSKLADLSSPILAQTCAMGKTIPKARLEFFRADGNGERVKYFEVELENVLIGMVKPHMGGNDSLLTENVNLKYSKIKWKYTQQKIGGGSGGNTAGGKQAGHVAGYDGKDWISDFIQLYFWAGPQYRNQRPRPSYAVYRY